VCIYGSRGSAGLLLYYKSGKAERLVKVTYMVLCRFFYRLGTIDILSGEDLLLREGTDLGSRSDWLD